MKNNIKYLTLIVAVSLTLLVGCTEFFDKIEDFNVGVTNTVFEQSAVIELKDYFGNHEDITNTDFTVNFSGADADKLVNEAGEFTISETDGFIQLNVNPNKSVGVKELNFDVTISGGDYRTETFPVTLKDTTSHVRLSLVNESKIYKGTNTATQTVGLTNNSTTAAATVQTDKTTSLNKSRITIEKGTQFKDTAGNTLTGADLNVEVINTDAASQILTVTEDLIFKDINGVEITDKTAQFITGNTSIKMNVGGTAVKTFNTPIAVAIEIPSGVTNPITGNDVKLGDDFPIYTSEENSTIWTYHGIGKVEVGDTTDTFNIAFETIHLSKYAVLNFEDIYCVNPYNPSTDEVKSTYNLTATNLPIDFSGFFEVELVEYLGSPRTDPKTYNIFSVWIQNGKMTWWTVGKSYYWLIASATGNFSDTPVYSREVENIRKLLISGSDISINPDNLSFYKSVQIIIKMNGVKVRDNISDIATVSNCEFSINFSRDLVPNIENLKSINIDVAGNCNGNNFIPDGFPFYVLRENGQFSYEGTIKKGKMTLNGYELGKEYIFKTVYKGKSLLRKWTFDSENFVDHNFEISKSVCDALGL
ncbi:MAG: hypothetical protein ACI9WV_001679 [Patiriisocius sp.]|jgi:hypothetical protein